MPYSHFLLVKSVKSTFCIYTIYTNIPNLVVIQIIQSWLFCQKRLEQPFSTADGTREPVRLMADICQVPASPMKWASSAQLLFTENNQNNLSRIKIISIQLTEDCVSVEKSYQRYIYIDIDIDIDIVNPFFFPIKTGLTLGAGTLPLRTPETLESRSQNFCDSTSRAECLGKMGGQSWCSISNYVLIMCIYIYACIYIYIYIYS